MRTKILLSAALVAAGIAAADAQQAAGVVGGELADELESLLVHREGLLEVDDVDLVAMAVDIRGHLRVPEARLVSEMDAGFQHFTHRDRHRFSKGWF